ncbi:MAG TPA: hypothetical protein VK140_00955 [Ktedonobacteraceae bacterium]|nr:hypothetical protein [Ktedonobacteraceae bacterium]
MSYNDPNQPYGQGQPQQPPYGQPPTQYTPSPTDYRQGQQPYGQPPPQAYGQQGQPYGGYPPASNYAQPQKKSSLRWLWITLAIVGGILVLACGGCIVASYAGINFLGQTVTSVLGPTTTANAYYQAIQNRDYTSAYTYLDTSGVTVAGQTVTQDAFVKAAQLYDTAKGPVTSFNQTTVNVDSSGNTASVTMSVTRNGSPYTVNLQLKKVGSDWKITAADNF